MDVHRNLGRGFLEIVYKDALEYEFRQKNVPDEREREFEIEYKNIILPHKYYADFVAYDKIILEVKATNGIIDDFFKQTLNYIKAAKYKLGILTNFGEDSLKYKRLVF